MNKEFLKEMFYQMFLVDQKIEILVETRKHPLRADEADHITDLREAKIHLLMDQRRMVFDLIDKYIV